MWKMDDPYLYYQYMWKICVILKLLLEAFIFFWNWTMGLHNYTRWKKANFHWTDSTLSMGILRLLGGRDCWHGTNMTSLCSSNSCHRLPFPEEPLLELFYPVIKKRLSVLLLDCDRSQFPLCILKHDDIFPNHIMSSSSV